MSCAAGCGGTSRVIASGSVAAAWASAAVKISGIGASGASLVAGAARVFDDAAPTIALAGVLETLARGG